MSSNHTISFKIGEIFFEYDEEKNKKNILKHGIDFRIAARVFFDYDRIEYVDERHSDDESRFNTIGDTSAGGLHCDSMIIGKPPGRQFVNDILFVVYTDRVRINENGKNVDVIRIISARIATNFERGVYYGKC